MVSPQGLWIQTGPLSFNFEVKGRDGQYQEVSDVPALTIPSTAGVWEISYRARSRIQAPGRQSMSVTTALFANGAAGPIPGSEALNSSPIAAGHEEHDVSFQTTVGQTFMHAFDGGEVLTLHAYCIGQNGRGDIVSDDHGRTGIMAHWVSRF